jgi:hypothetical protein
VPTVLFTRVGPAHVRFDVVNAAADDLLVDALEKGARRPPATLLRIDPNPSERAHQGQQVVAAEPLPPLEVSLGGMQIAAELFTADAAGHAAFPPLRITGMKPLPPSAQSIQHRSFLLIGALLTRPWRVSFHLKTNRCYIDLP